MELNTVLELLKAGFNHDEIMQMAQTTNPVTNPEPVPKAVDTPAQETEPAPVPAQVVEPVAVAEPAPVAQPVQTPAQDQPSMADIMQSIAKLTSAVQANAIAQSRLPAGGYEQPTAEDMIAEIIRPTFKERG